MITICPLQPTQSAEAKRTIYATAHEMFHDGETLEDTIAIYAETWPLRDVDTYQQSYLEQDGAFLVLCEDGKIIGTGALRRLDGQACEIKRLWLLPAYQGQGWGYRMMVALLEIARQKGYTVVRLETSPAYQPRAFQFYQRMGFREIPRYGDDPDDVGMEMQL